MAQRLSRAMARLGSALRSAATFATSTIGGRELLLAAGLALLAYGLSLVYWPAAFLVPGAIVTAVAIFGVR